MMERLRVGVITQTHGLRGDVKVFPTTEDPHRFKKLKTVILDLGREEKVLKITRVSFFKQFVILHFEGIDTIEEVQKYRGRDLLIDRRDAIPLEEGRYFIGDLLGLKVITLEGEELGVLTDVLETGANDVYEVRKDGEEKELLLPVIDECIKEINPQEGYIKVYLMPGLTEL